MLFSVHFKSKKENLEIFFEVQHVPLKNVYYICVGVELYHHIIFNPYRTLPEE